MIDYSYIGNMIFEMSGISVRVYRSGTPVFSRTTGDDGIMERYEKSILLFSARVSSYITPDLLFFGIVNHDDLCIVLGPTCSEPKIPKNIRERYGKAAAKLPYVPAEKCLQFLCMLNFFINNEKLSPADIERYTSFNDAVADHIRSAAADTGDIPDRQEFDRIYSGEQKMIRMIRTGDTDSLADIRDMVGVNGHDTEKARQDFVILSSIAVRTAIKSGMDTFEAFGQNRDFIERCEEMNNPADISSLLYSMIQYYTEEVHKLRMGTSLSRLVVDTASYIREHISEPIKTDQIAEALYLSRSHLSREFRLQSGMTLSDFIMLEKTEEAKRLLRYTEKPISDISTELGFSSQSHLIRIFRKYEGKTPGEYRNIYMI